MKRIREGEIIKTLEGGEIQIVRISDQIVWVQDLDEYGHVSKYHKREVRKGTHENKNRPFLVNGHLARVGYSDFRQNKDLYDDWIKQLEEEAEPYLCFQDYVRATFNKEVTPSHLR